jgi:hypothetical protein
MWRRGMGSTPLASIAGWMIPTLTLALRGYREKWRETMIFSMAGTYGFAGEAVYFATKFAQVGIAQASNGHWRRPSWWEQHITPAPMPRLAGDSLIGKSARVSVAVVIC